MTVTQQHYWLGAGEQNSNSSIMLWGFVYLNSQWHPGQRLREARSTSPIAMGTEGPVNSCVTISNAALSTTEVTPTVPQSSQVQGERTDTQPLGG